ncbi:MAG: DUF433 domain-containing protein [Caldilineaceae bacterium]
MSAQTITAPTIETTEHPYVVRVLGVNGGRATILGTRISVRQIAELYKSGELVEEIVQSHSQLTAASVFDALSYYLDHQAEIEQEILENRLETLIQKHALQIDDRGFIQFTSKAAAQ